MAFHLFYLELLESLYEKLVILEVYVIIIIVSRKYKRYNILRKA